MLKRAFVSLLTLFALLAPLTAHAYAERTTRLIHFQHRAAATAAPLGITDSSFVTHTGAITDTTEGFNLPGWAYTPYVLGADSLSLMDMLVRVSSTSTATAATDTFYVTAQGSFDGATWDPAPQVAVLELTNGAGLSFFKGWATTRLGAITAAAVTNLQLGAYPMYRFIIQTSAATVGRLTIRVQYWMNKNDY